MNAKIVSSFWSDQDQLLQECFESGSLKLFLHAQRGGTFATPIGEEGEFVAPIRSFRGFFYIGCASPIGGVRIAGPIALAQHKENERIGEARKTNCLIILLY